MPCAALLLKAGTRQIVASNRMACQIGAVPGTTCYAGLWKRTEPCPWCRAPQALASGQPQNFELSLDGKVWINYWLPISADLYLHYVVDHTEQVRVREALRQSEEKFKAIADYTVDWESWLSPEGKLLWVNPAVERFTGYSVAECQAMPEYPIPLIHEDDRDRIRSLLNPNAAGESRKSNVEFRYVRKDGVTEWGAVSWQPIRNSAGKSLGIRASIYDITERKQSEQKLAEYQQELRSLVSRISMAEEQERRRIAENLHDHLGQSLVFAKMKVDMLNRADLPTVAGATLGQISELMGGLIRTTQSITYDLSYPVLYERGLIEAIEEWIREEYSPKYGVRVSFHPGAKNLNLPTEHVGLCLSSRPRIVDQCRQTRPYPIGNGNPPAQRRPTAHLRPGRRCRL